jgi:hypothetical protein
MAELNMIVPATEKVIVSPEAAELMADLNEPVPLSFRLVTGFWPQYPVVVTVTTKNKADK